MSSVRIEFRKDRKKWQVTYYLEGVRKRPLFRTELEAQNFARKIRLGLSPESEDSITIEDAGKKYFFSESVKKNPKSRSNDRRYINLHFHFMTYERGIERLGSVELEDMEAFRDWLPLLTTYDQKPVSMAPSTVNRCLRVMKHFYKRHIQWKNIKESPCVYLEFLDAPEKDRPMMTGEQYLATLEKAEVWFKPILTFTFLTGTPPSCIARLTWDDVDLNRRTYSILRKKGAKARWKRIPMVMADPTFQLLVAIRNQSRLIGHVFRDPEGRPMLADRISRIANDCRRAAGIEGVTFYGLRHALASDMTSAGIATEIVRQAMGHQSIATTQRYANKVALKSITGALESVRGGSLVANDEMERRQRGAGN